MIKGVAVALDSVAAAVAVFQAEEELEGAELEDVEADAGLGGQAESETSSLPPYSVSVIPSIYFTAQQGPTMQYIMPPNDVAFRNTEKIV